MRVCRSFSQVVVLPENHRWLRMDEYARKGDFLHYPGFAPTPIRSNCEKQVGEYHVSRRLHCKKRVMPL